MLRRQPTRIQLTQADIDAYEANRRRKLWERQQALSAQSSQSAAQSAQSTQSSQDSEKDQQVPQKSKKDRILGK